MVQGRQRGVVFPEVASRPVEAEFDLPSATSDGGAILLKAADQKLGLSATLASCLSDPRDPRRVRHDVEDLLRQRMFGIACGYEDANDSSRLRNDPMQRHLIGRHAQEGPGLASQPTLSRFENAVTRTTCFRLGSALTDLVLRRHKKRLREAELVTVDLDGSVDPTHGAQQLSLFSGFYGTHCYLPLFGFLSFNDEPEQYLFSAVLRPGTTDERKGAIGVLRRVIDQVRDHFPTATIRVRLDGGFAGPEIFDFLDEEQVEYVVAMAKNSVLLARSVVSMCLARASAEALEETVTTYGHTMYAAKSWKGKQRRVVYKAEVLHAEGKVLRNNPRFVVTNLPYDEQEVYEIYTARGDAENRIKELKDGLQVDRTSCSGFWANQFRVLLTAAAYMLFQELRICARRTLLARAQVNTLRLALVKIGGFVRQSCRRISVRLSMHHPWQQEWLTIARVLGAIRPPDPVTT